MARKLSTKVQTDSGQAIDITLTAPWATVDGQHRLFATRVGQQSGRSETPTLQAEFLRERSRVHDVYIRETEKTRRFTIGTSASLIALAALITLFAPEGREPLSYALAAILMVFAAGAVGFQSLRMRYKAIDIELSRGRTSQSREAGKARRH